MHDFLFVAQCYLVATIGLGLLFGIRPRKVAWANVTIHMVMIGAAALGLMAQMDVWFGLADACAGDTSSAACSVGSAANAVDFGLLLWFAIGLFIWAVVYHKALEDWRNRHPVHGLFEP
jgi:hypothetical protein